MHLFNHKNVIFSNIRSKKCIFANYFKPLFYNEKTDIQPTNRVEKQPIPQTSCATRSKTGRQNLYS